jgi:hypothetical protein
MLKDIKQLTELYLHSAELLPEGKSWSDFHNELIQSAPKDNIGLLADANPKDKCKYALFVDVDTKTKTCVVKDYMEIGAVENWSSHLFWQGSGGARSDDKRNTPHKICSKKGDFSIDNFILPLETILYDYCCTKEGKEKKETGPLFWDTNNKSQRDWIENMIEVLEINRDQISEQVLGEDKKQGKFPSLKQGESVFVGLTVNGKPIGEYELFRRYLLFVRARAGIQKGTDRFKNEAMSKVTSELNGICPSCYRNKLLLDQWQSTAELSFYQTTNENHLSYAFPSSAFTLCQSCADLLFIFKQHLLETLTRRLGGNECLILPSIKLMPSEQKGKKRLYENLKGLWTTSGDIPSTEKRLFFRLGQLPSYATVTFVFGDYITMGKSQNVRRLDELNIIFPDVLPSRLSEIANAIEEVKEHLSVMWSLTGRTWNCTWSVWDDFRLLQELFHPPWDEDKKNKDKSRKRYKSLRRPEMERYLRAIFYAQEVAHSEIADDCYSNLLSAFKTSRSGKDDNDKYALSDYMGKVLSLMIFIYKLRNQNGTKKEVEDMAETNANFKFTAMPDLGKFIEMHPLLRDSQYLAPFFVGCLFSYVEKLQKNNSRLAAYNWLGTMALTYEDILQDIYPKVLRYITNKEKLVSSSRLQELTEAIAHFDKGKCDNDRVALVSFCHGWAIGRSFIMKKDMVKAIKNKLKELNISVTSEVTKYLDENKEKINAKELSALEDFLKLVPKEKISDVSSVWQKSEKEEIVEEGGDNNG